MSGWEVAKEDLDVRKEAGSRNDYIGALSYQCPHRLRIKEVKL